MDLNLAIVARRCYHAKDDEADEKDAKDDGRVSGLSHVENLTGPFQRYDTLSAGGRHLVDRDRQTCRRKIYVQKYLGLDLFSWNRDISNTGRNKSGNEMEVFLPGSVQYLKM